MLYTASCQQENNLENKKTLQINKKRRTFTREEQFEHGPERKKSFNRRWSKVPKKKIEELSAAYPGRNLFTFKLFTSVNTSNNLYARKKKYIYINTLVTTKRRSEYMSNEQRWASMTVNTNKLFKNDELKPDYVSSMSHNAYYAQRNTLQNKNISQTTTQNNTTIPAETKNKQKQERQQHSSPHKIWVPERRKPEDPTDAFMNMTKNNFMNSPEWSKFEALMGKEEALKWFEAGLKQATKPWD